MSTIASTADVIRTHAKERGDKVAIVQDDHRQTWAELDQRSNRVANALAAAGVGPEDRVAFIDKNGYEYFEVLFGAAKLNAVTVNVNWRLAPPEVAWIVDNAEAKVFFFGKEFADTVDADPRRRARTSAPSCASATTTASSPTSPGSATTTPTPACSPAAPTWPSSSTRRAPPACPRA